jgi:transcriptional regulator with XRE-family HTH domain
MPKKSLLEKIIKAAEKKGWKDGETAEKFGISKSGWSRIQRGQRGIESASFLRGVAKALPILRDDIIVFVVGKEDEYEKPA